MTQDTKKQPAAKLREGLLNAEVWENAREGVSQYNVTISRSYQDGEGNWRKSQSFGERDLLSLGHLTSRAHDAIRERKRELSQGQSERPKRTRSRQRDQELER